MFVLDTDHLTILQFQTQPEYGRIKARMLHHGPQLIFATAVSLQEQMLGAHTVIQMARKDADVLQGYRLIETLHQLYSGLQLLPFSSGDLNCFQTLKSQGIRIGTMDLRIASVALSRGFRVVSRNLRDFQRVPGLQVEDWTV